MYVLIADPAEDRGRSILQSGDVGIRPCLHVQGIRRHPQAGGCEFKTQQETQEVLQKTKAKIGIKNSRQGSAICFLCLGYDDDDDDDDKIDVDRYFCFYYSLSFHKKNFHCSSKDLTMMVMIMSINLVSVDSVVMMMMMLTILMLSCRMNLIFLLNTRRKK